MCMFHDLVYNLMLCSSTQCPNYMHNYITYNVRHVM